MSGKQQEIATVFGGTGFIGRQIVRELAKAGYVVKVATRVPEGAYFLKPYGHVGQIVPFSCDYDEPASIAAAVDQAGIVVNCIGILYEKKRGAFEKAHVRIPEEIARACKKSKVRRFVHISALGADKGTSKYARTKLAGEKAVKKAFKDVTILRPSVVFGPEDSFFNMFAEMSRYMPVLPLIGGGKTKFQPVYVGDVADAMMAAATLPVAGEQNPCGRTYELGGPEIVTFAEIYERLFSYTGRRRCLVSLPFGLAKVQAGFMNLLPHPPLTPDQVESLKTDNIVSPGAAGLDALGITPTSMEMILPDYLECYRSGGRLADKKRA